MFRCQWYKGLIVSYPLHFSNKIQLQQNKCLEINYNNKTLHKIIIIKIIKIISSLISQLYSLNKISSQIISKTKIRITKAISTIISINNHNSNNFNRIINNRIINYKHLIITISLTIVEITIIILHLNKFNKDNKLNKDNFNLNNNNSII